MKDERTPEEAAAEELRDKWMKEWSSAHDLYSDSRRSHHFRLGSTELGNEVERACFTDGTIGHTATKALLLVLLADYKDAIKTVIDLGGDVEPFIIGLIEAEIARVKLPKDDPGTWLVLPIGMGTAHVTSYGQHCWDKEACVVPELFNSARICMGPTGRETIDEWWRYRGHSAAIIAFASWMATGYEGEPKGWHMKSTRQPDDKHKTERATA